MSTEKVKNEEIIEQLKEKERQLVATYHRLFNTPDGKIVLADLMSQFYDRSSIKKEPGQPVDPYQTHAREGAREAIMYIKVTIEAGETNNVV